MCNVIKIITVFIIVFGLFFCSCCNLKEDDTICKTEIQLEDKIEFIDSTINSSEVTEPASSNNFLEQPTEPTEPETEPTEPTEPTIFSKDIILSYEYIDNGEIMPHGLFTPLNSSEEPKPLIVWLHGMGEFGVDVNTFNNSSLPKILKETTFEGFDAYVVCPHIIGKWYAPHWFRPQAVNNVKNMIDWFIENYNIDQSKIMISGHSSGGVGAMYIAHELPEYFCKMAILSGEGIGDKIYKINIPAKGYVENSGRHYGYMKYVFEPVFGEENLVIYNAQHSDIPEIVFTEDLDGNNRIDVIEWLLQDDNID